MKKIVVMGVLLGLLSVFFGSAQAASGGRFFFGAFAEIGQCLSYQVIGFGGVGYRISDLISVVAEGAAGHCPWNPVPRAVIPHTMTRG